MNKTFWSHFFPKIKKNALFTLLRNLSVYQISEQWEVWLFLFTVKLLTWGNAVSSGASNGILNKTLKLHRDVVSVNQKFLFPHSKLQSVSIWSRIFVFLATSLAKIEYKQPVLF